MTRKKEHMTRQKERLTPYQGSRRCFGYFECECGRIWQSGNSWSNTYQKCEGCGDRVYPYKQTKLEKVDDSMVDESKHHPQELCGKCKELGYCCKAKETHAYD